MSLVFENSGLSHRHQIHSEDDKPMKARRFINEKNLLNLNIAVQ